MALTLTPTNKLFMLSGEVGPGGAVIGEKGQFMQSLIFKAQNEDCILEIYSGGKKTTSEEVIDRLAGRIDHQILLHLFPLKAREACDFHMQAHLPITIIPSNKVNYVMEVVE